MLRLTSSKPCAIWNNDIVLYFYFKSDPHLSKKIFASMMALQKCFLFHFKSSFRSEDIKTFCSCRKNRLISKFMIISLCIAQYLTFFCQKSRRKWGRKNNSRLLFVSWKSFIWGKSKWSAAQFQYILGALNLPYNKKQAI